MRNQRGFFGMVVIDDMIIAIGGNKDTTSISNAEYFDDRKNEWFVCLLVHVRGIGVRTSRAMFRSSSIANSEQQIARLCYQT
jgi:hypothetical protein